MEKLTYKAYRTNPTVREQLDEEVRALRQEAIRQFIVAPLAGLSTRVASHFRAPRPHPVPKSA